MAGYQVIKIHDGVERAVFESDSPSEVVSLVKKLNKKAIREHSGVFYAPEPPVCLDCETPYTTVDGVAWCGCEWPLLA